MSHAASLCRRKDGSLIDVSVMISPIFQQDRVVGGAVIARDISQQVRTQRALEDEQQKVKGLLQRREEFLAMLSHELRNPLAAVVAATAVLEADASPERLVRCRGAIKRQVAHMKRLLDDLLDVSRLNSNKLEIERKDTDLCEAIDTAIEATAPLYDERNIELVQDIGDEHLHVTGDARRLAQVVANLLANAATYSPKHASVRLRVVAEASAIELHVEDHGEGIEPELQERIFDLFVQSEQRLDRSRGGLGVGLTLAKKIVELHRGAIRVRSAGRGKGSEFIVTLPRVVTAVHPALITAEHALVAGYRIVVVDDQQDTREMMRELLESSHHTVYDASDGAGAVQLIAQHKPHVAFIDLGLPVLDGFEVAQQIRRRPELRHVWLVALSGYGTHRDVQAALAAGFDEHLTKPAEPTTLERVIARAATKSARV